MGAGRTLVVFIELLNSRLKLLDFLLQRGHRGGIHYGSNGSVLASNQPEGLSKLRYHVKRVVLDFPTRQGCESRGACKKGCGGKRLEPAGHRSQSFVSALY